MTDVVTLCALDTSTDIAAWADAFPSAQAAMGEVVKNRTNPAFKSSYADLSTVLDAVMPSLNAGGFSVLQPVCVDSEGLVVVSTMILHKSGQWVRSTLKLRPMKSDPQGIGSTITYGRRYGLMAMAGVAPEDDDGNDASDRAPSPRNERAAPQIEHRKDNGERAVEYMGDFRSTMLDCETEGDLRALWDAHKGKRRDAGLTQDQVAVLIADLKGVIATRARIGQLEAAE